MLIESTQNKGGIQEQNSGIAEVVPNVTNTEVNVSRTDNVQTEIQLTTVNQPEDSSTLSSLPTLPPSAFQIARLNQLDILNQQMEKAKTKTYQSFVGMDRIKFLSDGVYSIVFTLLVYGFNNPTLSLDPSDEIIEESSQNIAIIVAFWPDIIIYFALVLILYIYWLENVYLLTIIQGADSFIGFCNVLSLMGCALLPFAFQLIKEWPFQFYSALILNCCLISIGIPNIIMWIYACYKRKFVPDDPLLPTSLIWTGLFRIAVPPLLYCFATGMAAIHTAVSYAILCLVPVLYILFPVVNADLFTTIRLVIQKIHEKRKKREVELQVGQAVVAFMDTNDSKYSNKAKNTIHNIFETIQFHTGVIERIKGFADCVFGIVLTFLVFQIQAPRFKDTVKKYSLSIEELSSWQLNYYLGLELVKLYREFLCYLATSLIVAHIWKTHTYLIRGMLKIDGLYVLFTVTLLSLVSLIPYFSYLLAQYFSIRICAILFNSLLCIVLLNITILFFYSISVKGRRESMPLRTKCIGYSRMVIPFLVYYSAIIVAIFSSVASICISLICPILDVLAAFNLDVYRFFWVTVFRVAKRCKTKPTKASSAEQTNLKLDAS